MEANNELKTLAAEETHEIERILSAFSAEVAEFQGAIAANYHNITDLAFCFALATLATNMRANMPNIKSEQIIQLRRARHPLIPKERVVPIDVSVGGEYDTLIITGPNTGGKTVTLKTLGLFALMAQSGMQIPAAEGSSLGVFSEILVDIGDEQSIEASLSTFSSHMVTVGEILKSVGPRSLALFDELGSGTDPVEGAALAISILEKTRSAGALCAATTHYAELKIYALNTHGVMNASCEFDVETLRPTYRLVVGTPGKSNAFAISEKLGIDPEVIARARELIDKDDKRFEDVIDRLEGDRIAMERARQESEKILAESRREAERREAELNAKIKKSEDEIQKMLLKARQILDSARATSEFIFKQLDDIRRQENREKRDEMAQRARAEVDRRMRESEKLFEGVDVREIALDEDYKLPRPLKVGDRVYLVTVGKEGVVTALADKKGLVSVTAGILKTKVTEDKLRLIDGDVKFVRRDEPKPRVNEGKVKRTVNTSFKPELDVRGMIGDDAWFLVDKYIDDAILAGIKILRIIHGKGTGALRAALWKYFKADKRIKSYRHGEYGEGDAGVTVLELK